MNKELYTESLINLTLYTTKEISKEIIKSNENSLSDKSKEHFIPIMELFHIIMISRFQEFPDYWTSENIIKACDEIIPSIIPEIDPQYIKEILLTYIKFVGIAEQLHKEVYKLETRQTMPKSKPS